MLLNQQIINFQQWMKFQLGFITNCIESLEVYLVPLGSDETWKFRCSARVKENKLMALRGGINKK